MASPIVCVLKKDKKSVWIMCDFRYVNNFKVSVGLPMSNLEDIELEVGRSNFISVLDANSGYWLLEVRPEDRWLPAFTTNENLYE